MPRIWLIGHPIGAESPVRPAADGEPALAQRGEPLGYAYLFVSLNSDVNRIGYGLGGSPFALGASDRARGLAGAPPSPVSLAVMR